MKSVLRSCFDPLPRFMSTRSLIGLVTMVLIGTGISVYEYLESSHAPVRAGSTVVEDFDDADVGAPSECGARDRADRCRTVSDAGFAPQPSPAPGVSGVSGVEQVSECTRPSASDAPSIFEPANEHAGS